MKKQTTALLLALIILLASAACRTPVPDQAPPIAPKIPYATHHIQALLPANQELAAFYLLFVRPYEKGGLFAHPITLSGFDYTVEYGNLTLADVIGTVKLEELYNTYGNQIPALVLEKEAEKFRLTRHTLHTIAGPAYDAVNDVYIYDKIEQRDQYYHTITAMEYDADMKHYTFYMDGYNKQTGEIEYCTIFSFRIGRDGITDVENTPTPLQPDGTPIAFPESGTANIILYEPETKSFTFECVPAAAGMSHGEFVKLVCDMAGIPALEYTSIRLHESYNDTLIYDFSKEDVRSNFTTKAEEERALYSLAMSVYYTFEHTRPVLTIEQEPYHTTHLQTGERGHLYPYLFDLGSYTAEEYAAIRGQIPYPGMSNEQQYFEYYQKYMTMGQDPVDKEILLLLFRLGIPEKDVDDPSEFSDAYLIDLALRNTSSFVVMNFDKLSSEEISAQLTLLPIAIGSTADSFQLENHMSATMRCLFGITDMSTINGDEAMYPYNYDPLRGIYNVRAHGIPPPFLPYIYSIDVVGEETIVTIAYFNTGMQDDNSYYPEGLEYFLEEETFHKYMATQTTKREITLLQHPDGSYYLKSVQTLPAQSDAAVPPA